MSSDNKVTAWQPLIDEWVEREQKLRPGLPVQASSVRVRDAIEVDDQAFILLSYDVDHPWPSEENLSSEQEASYPQNQQTAVIQAERARHPWLERDAARAGSIWRADPDAAAANDVADLEAVVVHEYVLGTRRIFSGCVEKSGEVTLTFFGEDKTSAAIIDGWFIAVVEGERSLESISFADGGSVKLSRADIDSLLADPISASNHVDAMYFSPLDLRSVKSLVQWERSGDIVAVATCIEQYDEGGILRLRIDGTRADDDTFVSWPRVTLQVDDKELPSAVCGEYSLADTISLDIGFRPELPQSAKELKIKLEGIRGADGEIAPMELNVKLR